MPPRTLNRWWLKAAAQGALSVAPGASRLSDAVRHRRGPFLREDYFRSKWAHLERHLQAVGEGPASRLPALKVLEIGTGWFPIVPLGLALHDADVVTIDTRGHLDPRRVRLAMQMLSDLAAAGTISVGSATRLARLRELLTDPGEGSTSELLRPLGISPRIADARDLGELPEAHGATLLVSNNTLEHIPGPVLGGILSEFHRVGAPEAVMSHYIDLADHYAGFDPRINEFHFLTLGVGRWRLANNRLGYQNRLRIGDYRQLHEQAGWRLTHEALTRRKSAVLDGITVVPPFDTVPVRDLLVVKAHLVSRRA